MCGILALFGADPQASSELRAELLRWQLFVRSNLESVKFLCLGASLVVLLQPLKDSFCNIIFFPPLKAFFCSIIFFQPLKASAAPRSRLERDHLLSQLLSRPRETCHQWTSFWSPGGRFFSLKSSIFLQFSFVNSNHQIYFQPITNINGDTALSVNGEIYNHIVSTTILFCGISHFRMIWLLTSNLKE